MRSITVMFVIFRLPEMTSPTLLGVSSQALAMRDGWKPPRRLASWKIMAKSREVQAENISGSASSRLGSPGGTVDSVMSGTPAPVRSSLSVTLDN